MRYTRITHDVPIGPVVRVPLTAVLLIDSPLEDLRTGDIRARMELIPSLDTDAIEIDGRPLDRASDGVVKYSSAHIEGVESELIVRSPHSGMQAAPPTIEEVRRILLAHSERSSCPAPAS